MHQKDWDLKALSADYSSMSILRRRAGNVSLGSGGVPASYSRALYPGPAVLRALGVSAAHGANPLMVDVSARQDINAKT
jgi:hypothetical protein